MWRRGSQLLFAFLLLAACTTEQSSGPVLVTRFELGANSSTSQSVEVGEVPAGFDSLEVTTSASVELSISVRAPSRYVFRYTWDALHRTLCEELETGEQLCTETLEHAEIPAGTWDVWVKNQSDVDTDVTVRVIDAGPGWGLAGGLVAVMVLMFGGFLFWWRASGPVQIEGQPADLDPRESRERLDLLKATHRWGEISTKPEGYLKPRSRR